MAKRKTTKNKKPTALSHVKASLVYVAPHKHTGHRLPHRHTSHGLLFLLLLVGGVILFLSLATLEAAGITKSGNLTITAVVPGAPPTVGAVITTPLKKSSFKNSLVDVSGTCPNGTIVSVYNNGQFSSATNCTIGNTFSTTIQLRLGVNMLQAQNYDSLNQAGPVTDQIEVAYEPDVAVTATNLPPAAINRPSDIRIDTSIPFTPVAQPDQSPCYNQPPVETPSTNLLGMSISCVTRNIFIGEKIELPVSLWGGIGPYALSVDWGDTGKAELFSIPEKGRHILSHTYLIPTAKSISLHLADTKGQSYQLQAVVQVNTNTTAIALTGANGGPFQSIVNAASSTWVEASVPIYWAAVSLFLGFWVGDLFQRFIKPKKTIRRRA
ncbi:MAG: hypothetical protein ABIP50_01750 [Candidatus Saccharimonadales bacterium]